MKYIIVVMLSAIIILSGCSSKVEEPVYQKANLTTIVIEHKPAVLTPMKTVGHGELPQDPDFHKIWLEHQNKTEAEDYYNMIRDVADKDRKEEIEKKQAKYGSYS